MSVRKKEDIKINKMRNQTFGIIPAKWLLVAVGVFSGLILPVLTKTALLVIDVQQCFLSGGSLAVTDGEDVIPVINNIRRKYGNQIALTVFSQDWHCKDHVSFASQHDGYNAYDVITLQYDSEGKLCKSDCNAAHFVNQTLWPDHCVINRTDAEFSPQILRKADDLIVKKGYNCDVDSYSAFYDNGGFSKTELEDILKKHGIDTVIVTGLALDFCVYYTSKDAKQIGLDVHTVVDASRPVNKENVPQILETLRTMGVHVINSSELDQAVSTASFLAYHLTPHALLMYTIPLTLVLFLK